MTNVSLMAIIAISFRACHKQGPSTIILLGIHRVFCSIARCVLYWDRANFKPEDAPYDTSCNQFQVLLH